ncbi:MULTISPECIES: ROK family protein [Bacillus cereus group]|uniref:Kinase n=1 Tax=Bacillus cereus TaxID=1396 RepID=A0A2B8T094_BACCE|nr:ROK family protein [Bacillus cereus]PDY83894.1 kinase [Bacillus cereus]PFA06717.1 kinase [Bacillus cereus]PFM43330.1 kinase [Bacillus cereus]PGL60054.1 kinase [Bacillus cereus]PGQ11690.1 kinase [Bacillus cereus]
MKKAIGIDIGGTKIAAGIISDTGELLERAEVKSAPSDSETMFGRVVEAVEQVLRKSLITIADIEGIGVGVPGKVDCEKGIAVFQNNLPWRQFPISIRLQEQFGIQRITVDNDVYMAAYAEWRAAHVKRNETFVYVTISTGISCSIIHKGSFFRGAGFAGELGLIPVLSKGINERLEKIAAGPGIQRIAEKELQVDTISTKDVFAGYINEVPEYQFIINEVTDYLTQGLYSISSLLDPHKMVFGGSVIVKNPFLLELIKAKLKMYQLPEQQHLLDQMSISTLAQNNGVAGAGLRVFEGM